MGIDNLITRMIGTLDLILLLLFALITIYFIWGVAQYVSAGGDDEKLTKGRKHMLWGIIGLAVVASAWGLARLIINYARVDEGGGPRNIPSFRNLMQGANPGNNTQGLDPLDDPYNNPGN